MTGQGQLYGARDSVLGFELRNVLSVALFGGSLVLQGCEGRVNPDDSSTGGLGSGGLSWGGASSGGSPGTWAMSSCSELGEAECGPQNACRAIVGFPINEARECFEADEEFLGCFAYEVLCGASLTLGQDPDGNRWHLSNTCVPEGWDNSDSSSFDACGVGGAGGEGGAP